MDINDAIKKRRTVRFFKQDPLDTGVLIELIEAGRCAPSAANKQPLEYVIVEKKQQIDGIFDQLAWAGYIQPKRNPPAGKRPVAYIIVLVDKDIMFSERSGSIDAAAAIENILLTAQGKGIGSCWLGSVNRENVRKILTIPDKYIIDSVVALGYPGESPVMEYCKTDSIEYYLDETGVLHVPKRPVRSITHINKFGESV